MVIGGNVAGFDLVISKIKTRICQLPSTKNSWHIVIAIHPQPSLSAGFFLCFPKAIFVKKAKA
jgi:hypothetical protein